ncbi:MAG: helix-turn-helix transcriptional regulator [Chroococcidiopsidaceae cyanobacterium CP_BM_RX_35]|nr:helix-turn-helix transcriptional regulator [Chroococcidiopsidaceae cyanobacterium CP_BM_RX_35]
MAEKIDSEWRARVFAALSDLTRLRIVELLAVQDEMSGSEIAEKLGISLALYCHHSKLLNEVGLVKKRKEGQTKYSSLNREILSSCFNSLINCT